MTGPKIRPKPDQKQAQRTYAEGQYAKVIVEMLTMARDADLILFDRMEEEVFRILGVRYQLPEIFR